MKSKRGSFTVFIMIVTVSLVSMLLIFIKVSKDAAIKGAANGMALLWSDSILSEYELNLYERYGIFAFRGIAPEINGKIAFYAEETFRDKKGLTLSSVKTDLKKHSLMYKWNFRKQLLEHEKLSLAGKLAGKKSEARRYGEKQPVERDPGELFSGLPSGGSKKSVGIGRLKSLFKSGSFSKVIKSGGRRYLEMEYAMERFKDQSDDRDIGETFLENEVEYLICGKKGDALNEKSIKRKIVALRLASNTLFAMTDPGIRAETIMAAEFMTPGPASIATQKALQAAWAYAESVNDYNLLVNGKKVPMYKDSMSWALDLESVVKGGIRRMGEGSTPGVKKEVFMVDPKNKSGDEYSDYMKLMLFMTDEKVLLLRMLDIIEMNMRYSFYSDFRVRDYNTGLTLKLGVNDNVISVKRSYLRNR